MLKTIADISPTLRCLFESDNSFDHAAILRFLPENHVAAEGSKPVAPVAPAIQNPCRGFLIFPSDQELNQQHSRCGFKRAGPPNSCVFLLISPGNHAAIRSTSGITINPQNILPSSCRLLILIGRYRSRLIHRSLGSHSKHHKHLRGVFSHFLIPIRRRFFAQINF